MHDELFSSIPRTKEEMDSLRAAVANKNVEKIIENAMKTNEKIENAKRMAIMFQSEAFQNFWRIAVDEMEKVINVSIPQIKGTPAEGQRYDPLGQLAQLNTIQGGYEMIESLKIQRRIIEETAKGKPVDIEELKKKINSIN